MNARTKSAVKHDPVYNAIKIQERLSHTVRFFGAHEYTGKRLSKEDELALNDLREKKQIFAVTDGDRVRYPAFQFTHRLKPLSVMAQILESVPSAAHGWPLLSVLEAGMVMLKGKRPSECLISHPDEVVSLVKRFYARD